MTPLLWFALLVAGFYGCLVTIALSYYAGERAQARKDRKAEAVESVSHKSSH